MAFMQELEPKLLLCTSWMLTISAFTLLNGLKARKPQAEALMISMLTCLSAL